MRLAAGRAGFALDRKRIVLNDVSLRIGPAASPVMLEAQVLDGVSLTLARGDSLGLVGESGSGKTIAALALMGLLPPGARAAGRIGFDGQDLLRLDERALCRLRAGGPDALQAAREDASAALRLRPEAPRPHGRAGDCAAEAGAWAQAAAHYSAAVRLAAPGSALGAELGSRLAVARRQGRCRPRDGEEGGYGSPTGLARNASTASLEGLLPGSPLEGTGGAVSPDPDGPEAAVQAALAAYARERKGRRREEPSGAHKSPKRSHGVTPEGTPPRGASPAGDRHALPSQPPEGFDPFGEVLWGAAEEAALLEADGLLSEIAFA
jgi:energy-coupling factor transporter ATP-binding protein EcfA2